MVVDSPPGTTSPSTPASSSGRFTGTDVAPADSSARRCSLTSPCNARTPIFTALLPAPAGQPLALREVRDVYADHRLAEAARHLCDDLGLLEVRGGVDDGLRAGSRVAGLEDAGPDE